MASLLACGNTNFETFSKINSGGGGTAASVYSASIVENGNKVAIKESWRARYYLKWPLTSSASTVLRECEVLKHLNSFNIENIEECIDSCYDSKDQRSSIVLSPLFASTKDGNDPDSSRDVIKSITNIQIRQQLTSKLIRTVIEMIAIGNTVSKDIQILVNSDTGDLLFIDFTETLALNPPKYNSEQLAAIATFLQDAMSYIPDDCRPQATASMRKVVNEIEASRGSLSAALMSLLVEKVA